jgi:DNA processing protein
MTTHKEHLLAAAYLLRVAEPPALAVRELVAEHGVVMAAELVRDGEVPRPAADETEARRHLDLAAADLAEAAAAGARLVTPAEQEWPAWPLTALASAAARGLDWAVPPLGLWVRGKRPLAELLSPAVAVVGARAATGYGEHVAGEFGYGLADAGYTVVSGAAYGVDAAAHRGALAADGPTVAVLACGVDVAYPSGHAELLRLIAETGAVLSEYPPGTPPGRHRFLVRNRLIASLGEGTVVVEAGRRSGARNTAATAGAIGRVVMAVPGPVSSAMSVGCHELLRSGHACVVTTAAEVAESVGRFGTDLVAEQNGERRDTDQLDGEAMRVYEALGTSAARDVDRVAVESGVALPRLRALLPALELSGLAVRSDAGWRRGRAGGEQGG